MSQSFSLANRIVGTDRGALIIGEIAQAHDGSLGMAHAYIDAIASAGADAIKFQTHIAAAESTRHEPWRVKFSQQDDTRYDYWQRMEFTPAQWQGLKQHADEVGLLFLSSPFSEEAVQLLEALDIPAWKVASGEVTNQLLFEAMATTGKPILLSSGMSSFADLDRASTFCRERHLPYSVFQCTTAYPCPPEKVGLNLIGELRDRYQVPIGISDHSGTIFPSLAAATLGVELIEVHVTMSREMFGPDVPASVTTTELKQLVEGVRFIERARAAPCEKDQIATEMDSMRSTFGKSIVLRADQPAGVSLTRSHLTAKKAGGGIPTTGLGRVIGQTLARSVSADEPLQEDMFQDRGRKCS